MEPQKRPVWFNYFYFGSLFSLLILLSVSSVYSHEDLAGSRIFFLLYSIGESLLEVTFFIFAGWLIQKYFHPICFGIFIAFTFICFLLHLIDFMLERIMNFSIWETIGFVFDESFDNFINMLDASGLPLWIWGAFFVLLLAVPLIGIAIFRITAWISHRRPVGLCFEKILQISFCIPIALFFWDFSASRFVHHEAHRTFIKTLPWKITFLKPNTPTLSLRVNLPEPSTEQELLASLESFDSGSLASKPNIYLFIAESLREDMLKPHIAPHLSAFRDRSSHATLSLSNANATQISWYSIFHSDFPYYWSAVGQQKRKTAAPGIELLRKMGYQIHVYSSANLFYYGMDELLFGENQAGVDSLQIFSHTPPKETWTSDKETLDTFAKEIVDNPELEQGQCFIFFWDSTHFDYSWPKSEPPRFFPVANELNYFKAYHSKKNIEAIKNRYRNAVHYIDSLFGRFLTIAPKVDESIIVFTGDHGEEFFEHGHLFHLSELNDVQTQVPIYFQLPQQPAVQPALATHMDIFPTILSSLTENSCSDVLKGQSLLMEKRWPYVVMARYNASRTPYEICLHNGRHKFTARFAHERDIFSSPFLRILSVRTAKEGLVNDCKNDLESWIQQEFGEGLGRLFPDR